MGGARLTTPGSRGSSPRIAEASKGGAGSRPAPPFGAFPNCPHAIEPASRPGLCVLRAESGRLTKAARQKQDVLHFWKRTFPATSLLSVHDGKPCRAASHLSRPHRPRNAARGVEQRAGASRRWPWAGRAAGGGGGGREVPLW